MEMNEETAIEIWFLDKMPPRLMVVVAPYLVR
jgi:hypothetical protein